MIFPGFSKQDYPHKRRGFTLIELLVVSAIAVMVFGVVISYGGIGEEQVLLYTETSRVIQNVLRSRSLAVTAYLETGLRICGHGIWIINEREFALVRFLREEDGGGTTSQNCSQIGDPGQNINNYEYATGNAILSRDILAPGITFDLGGQTAPFIVFRPPDPDIYFYGADGTIFDRQRESVFYLQGPKGGRMEVTVGQGGQVTYGLLQ